MTQYTGSLNKNEIGVLPQISVTILGQSFEKNLMIVNKEIFILRLQIGASLGLFCLLDGLSVENVLPELIGQLHLLMYNVQTPAKQNSASPSIERNLNV